MKFRNICIVLFLLIISVAAVSASEDIDNSTKDAADATEIDNTLKTDQNDIYKENEKNNTFTDLNNTIDKSGDTLEMDRDYMYDSSCDNSSVKINKNNFTINGNNHIIDANNKSRIFNITGNNITLKNLIFKNANTSGNGGAIYNTGNIILINITFINNFAKNQGGAIYSTGNIAADNLRFIDNYAETGGSISISKALLNLSSSSISSNRHNMRGQIYNFKSSLILKKVDFINISSDYAPALYNDYPKNVTVTNSRFINLTANITSGAIAIRYPSGNITVSDCEFTNVKSFKNGGAIITDCAMDNRTVEIVNTVFNNVSSMFGGAYNQLGGRLFLINSNFTDNKAGHSGGAIYVSFVKSEMKNCIFKSNRAEIQEDYYGEGGALYADYSDLLITDCSFINNSASYGNAIIAYDTVYNIANSTFANNSNAILTCFDKNGCNLQNNTYNNDTFITNITYNFDSLIDSPASDLKFINTTIDVDNPPSRFDLRDWGWVTPVRNQQKMGSCWTFSLMGALESALLKSYNIEFDLSEGNMFHNILRYFECGSKKIEEDGEIPYSASYLVSWLGPALEEKDSYDEVGKLSPYMDTSDVVHVQDVIFLANDEIPNGTKLKTSIMKYGALAVSYYAATDDSEKYYNTKTYAQYINESLAPDHGVSIVGWDDNYSASNFLITPPGDGAWIIRNSWGTNWGDKGYSYVSYYDKSLIRSVSMMEMAYGIIIENTVPYNKNYEHEFIWMADFINITGLEKDAGNITYANQFEAAGDDLIAAVGTYFNSKGVNYKVEIYVNDKLKATQEGVSPFCGFHTIKLNEYVPIKKGETFKAVITSNSMPFVNASISRLHYRENLSFYYYNNEWVDLYKKKDLIASLKVYTVEDTNHIINYTFKDLSNHINESGDILEIMHDYKSDNESKGKYVLVNKSNFIINGNNHILDANKQSGILRITGKNVTINNLIFKNANITSGGAIYASGEITLNNVTFINNYAERGASIRLSGTKAVIRNASFTSDIPSIYGQIFSIRSTLIMDNVDFTNISSTYSPAIHTMYLKNLTITNSRFNNLTANITAGAISVRWPEGNVLIKDCEFVNIKSFKNAGALYMDMDGETYNVTIIDTVFENDSSMFGGALIQLEGNLIINGSNFTNNKADHDGGAIYLSFTKSVIDNCVFNSNSGKLLDDYPPYGGAIYSYYGSLNISDCEFINNTAYLGNAIFTQNGNYVIYNSTFANNTNAICTVNDLVNGTLENNIYNNDSVRTNIIFYAPSYVDSPAEEYKFINNTIDVSELPSRFDLRDWGWDTPVKDQSQMGSCWTFGVISSLESAILKAYGIELDLSEGNLFHNMLRYFPYGNLNFKEGGLNTIAVSYLLGWYGPILEKDDAYDEVGKISPYITTGNDTIHIQDVIFISNDEIPNGTKIKNALMKYGALSVAYCAESDNSSGYYNPKTSAQYINETKRSNHMVALVGWDDNYPASNFLITPPGDGAWIIKNSWGTEWGDKGYHYVSYYDKSFLTSESHIEMACGIIIENTIPYNKNYYFDYGWADRFNDFKYYGVDKVTVANQFEAVDDDLIAAVGTYFNESDVNYTVEIYVNEQLILSQNDLSPYAGFHTIKLNEYIPIKKGDSFTVALTSNTIAVIKDSDTGLPYKKYSCSVFDQSRKVWYDLNGHNIPCIKVYTVSDDSRIIDCTDITAEYNTESYFSVRAVTSDGHAVVGGAVNFTVDGNTTTVLTDGEGIAKLPITNLPGVYVITTTFNNQTWKNNLTVKLNLNNCKVTNNSDITVDYNGGSYFTVKVVSDDGKVAASGASVIFKINGKQTTVITDENGIARIKITDIPNKYTMVTAFNGKTYSNTVTVKQVLKAKKVKVKKTANKFYLKAKLKINGKKIKGEVIKFKFKGKTYKVKTNKKGIAKVKINKKIIKKLKKGKKYSVKVTYLKDTIKTTVKVK